MSTSDAGGVRELVEHGIPFLRKVVVRVDEAEGGRARLHLPYDRSNDNYVGTVHAAALFSLGETCAGVAAGTAFDLRRVRMLARQASIEYLKPVTTDIVGTAEIPPEIIASAGEKIEREGRATLPIHVTMTAAGSQLVARMTVEYHFRRGQGESGALL